MRYRRKVMSLRVKCPYAEMKPYDCKWIGKLNDLVKVKRATDYQYYHHLLFVLSDGSSYTQISYMHTRFGK